MMPSPAHADLPDPPVVPTSATFAERYRRMRSRWNEDWWSITLGGPLGNVLNGLIADLPWVKPNRITWLSFLCLLASGPLLLLGSRGADVAAVVLLQLHTILDCMDGSLARYRKASSVMGAFLDKVTDMIGLLVVMACFGWRVWVDTGDAFALLVATLIAGSIVLRGYVFWVVASLERERKVQKPTVGDRRRDCSTMSFGERAALYVRSQWKIVEFAESDLYFWLGLGVALGRMRQTVYFLGVATGFWAAVILGWRYWTVRKLEAAR